MHESSVRFLKEIHLFVMCPSLYIQQIDTKVISDLTIKSLFTYYLNTTMNCAYYNTFHTTFFLDIITLLFARRRHFIKLLA